MSTCSSVADLATCIQQLQASMIKDAFLPVPALGHSPPAGLTLSPSGLQDEKTRREWHAAVARARTLPALALLFKFFIENLWSAPDLVCGPFSFC